MSVHSFQRPSIAALTSEPAIQMRQLTKDYASTSGKIVRALDPIDLNITAGSFVAIVGRSGCGKSTLLRLAAVLEQPTAGQLRINGQSGVKSVRYVFQNYGESLLPWLSVGKNVEFGLRHTFRANGGERNRGEQMADLVESYLAEVGPSGHGDALPCGTVRRHAAAAGDRARTCIRAGNASA